MTDKNEAERIEKAKQGKSRKQRPFPACSFMEAMELAQSVLEYGSGQAVRRISVFDHIGKSPESGPSRQWVTNANKYGLIKGGYQAEHLELTPEGAKAVDDEISKREQAKARVKLAVDGIPIFKGLFDRFSGNKLPARAALVDAAKDLEIPEVFAEEAVDTFIVNIRDLGLLQTLSGAERIVSIDHLLDTLPTGHSVPPSSSGPQSHVHAGGHLVTLEQANFDSTCFYVTPIGEEGSEHRKHSDLFLGSIVEPALEQFGLLVVRADSIDKPGVITRQIIDYLLRARLVIVDLSYHNPNVFYELAIRHAARLPVVQIIRAADRIPFDVNQVRTIKIDTSDIFSLVPKIDTYRSEIANQVRRALDNPDSVDNPITTFYPNLKVQIDG
ncbi:MAG: hypothetical protein V7756_09230 [Halopseudomonas sp.]|uniref:hypothetical protein n=1 Tax=Halopseudomonas sp. TaxID=2901191 RepID=UPI0030031CCE